MENLLCRPSAVRTSFFQEKSEIVFLSLGNKFFAKGGLTCGLQVCKLCLERLFKVYSCTAFKCGARGGATFCKPEETFHHRLLHIVKTTLCLERLRLLEVFGIFQHLLEVSFVLVPHNLSTQTLYLLNTPSTSCLLHARLVSLCTAVVAQPCSAVQSLRGTSGHSISDHPICICPLPAPPSPNTEK